MWVTSIKALLPILVLGLTLNGCASLGGKQQDPEQASDELESSLDSVAVELQEKSASPDPTPPWATDPSAAHLDGQQYRDEAHRQQAYAARDDYNRALSDLKRGELELAFERLQKLHQAYPLLAAPLVNMAIIKREQSNLAEALALLEQAAAIDAENPLILTELGLLNRQLGNFDAAKTNYETAIAVDANYAKAHYNLGVLADLYLHDPNLALVEFEAYQSLLSEPNKTVTGWIAELKRRTKSTRR